MSKSLDEKLHTPTTRELDLAENVWNYMILGEEPKTADIIWGLGSIDTLPAIRVSELFKKGYSDIVVFSGGVGGRNYSLAEKDCNGMTEASMLADVAEKYGVPRSKMILEEKSTNSGENVKFTKQLLGESNIKTRTALVTHMPYAERRDKATINKHWPDLDVTMTSPSIPFREYHINGYQSQMTQSELIGDLLGDFQRLTVFSEPQYGFNFMVPQIDPIPQPVKDAYNELVDRGFTQHLVKDRTSGNILTIQ